MRKIGVLSFGTFMLVGLAGAVFPNVASANSTVPTVTLVSPDHGPVSGGTFVTISGRAFDGATALSFGATPAPTGWYVKSPDTIKAIAPAVTATSTVVITVTTPSGTSSVTATTNNVFSYVTGPTIQDVTPGTGPTTGGTRVTIAGQGFACPCGVTLGGVAASFTPDSSTELSAITPGPESPGAVPVVVTTSDGTTPTDPAARFTYADEAPSVASLSPSTGTQGTVVTVVGSHFEKSRKASTTVYFGATPGSNVKVMSAHSLTVDAPAGSGTVDVTVSDSKGTSGVNEPGDEFTYSS